MCGRVYMCVCGCEWPIAVCEYRRVGNFGKIFNLQFVKFKIPNFSTEHYHGAKHSNCQFKFRQYQMWDILLTCQGYPTYQLYSNHLVEYNPSESCNYYYYVSVRDHTTQSFHDTPCRENLDAIAKELTYSKNEDIITFQRGTYTKNR